MKYFRLIISFTVILICCLSVSITTSAVSYINQQDIKCLQNIMKNTVGVEHSCDKLVDTYGNEFSLFKIYTKAEAEKAGIVSKDYLPTGFGVIDLDYRFVSDIDREEKRIILEGLKDAFTGSEASQMSREARQMIYDELRVAYGDDIEYIQKELIDGIQPNMFLAYEAFLPFRGIIGTFLGCICLITIVSTVLSVVIDFMYMQVPEFRERTYQATHKAGRGRFSFVQNRSHIDRPWFVTYEAAYASKKSLEDNGNALIIYLKNRIIAIVAISISLVYLTSGVFMNVVTHLWSSLPNLVDMGLW